MKKIIIIATIFLASCSSKDTDKNFYHDINLRIVSFNSDCSLSNDKFRRPQLCNTILFETLNEPKLYTQINTCKMSYNIHIDVKWLYNHQIGDTIHFDYLLKKNFFTINAK
jgi:hypothetical protein